MNLPDRDTRKTLAESDTKARPSIVRDLSSLIHAGLKYSTIYADPPWRYTNVASRAAAENHYSTLSIDEICGVPVESLAENFAHLHLWTTNAFLREAFEVIEAWGFQYKSCLIWIKPQLGMGNYWRVSHEYLCDRSHKNSYMTKLIMWRRPRIHVQRRKSEIPPGHIISPPRACRSGLLRGLLASFIGLRLEKRRICAAHRGHYVAFPRQPTRHLKAVTAVTPHKSFYFWAFAAHSRFTTTRAAAGCLNAVQSTVGNRIACGN